MSARNPALDGQDPAKVGELLGRAAITLGMHHPEFAKLLGVSRRTVSRWIREGTWLFPQHGRIVVERVHRFDSDLAAEIAALFGETLVSLGLEDPPAPPLPPPPPPTPRATLLNAVVCAAAEAGDVSPRLVRPALLAAFRAAREVGLTMDAMEAMLAAATEGKKK